MTISITWSKPRAGISYFKSYPKAAAVYGPAYADGLRQFKASRSRWLKAKFRQTGQPLHEWADFVEAEFDAHLLRINPHLNQK